MGFMLRMLVFLGAAAMLCGAASVLKVSLSGKIFAFTAEEFKALPQVEVTALEPHGQKEHLYAGVAVKELLLRAGAPLGDKLRGQALQLAVIVHSKDDYAVVFSLADFDEAFGNCTILLSEKEDGQPLPEKAAPFRLIVVGDKRAARWARIVNFIEVVPVGSAAISPRP